MVQCGLEIFSIFMLEIASRIKRIDGTFDERLRSTTEQQFSLSSKVKTHSFISKLLEILANRAPDLFGDVREAQLVVIPAFLKYDLLSGQPPEPTSEVSSQASVGASHESEWSDD